MKNNFLAQKPPNDLFLHKNTTYLLSNLFSRMKLKEAGQYRVGLATMSVLRKLVDWFCSSWDMWVQTCSIFCSFFCFVFWSKKRFFNFFLKENKEKIFFQKNIYFFEMFSLHFLPIFEKNWKKTCWKKIVIFLDKKIYRILSMFVHTYPKMSKSIDWFPQNWHGS